MQTLCIILLPSKGLGNEPFLLYSITLGNIHSLWYRPRLHDYCVVKCSCEGVCHMHSINVRTRCLFEMSVIPPLFLFICEQTVQWKGALYKRAPFHYAVCSYVNRRQVLGLVDSYTREFCGLRTVCPIQRLDQTADKHLICKRSMIEFWVPTVIYSTESELDRSTHW